MTKIDAAIVTTLHHHAGKLDENMQQAYEKYERLKREGIIQPNTYDIPLMTRLSSGYTDSSRKHKLAADTEA
ncbi:MAG: hypothetical protein EOM12_10165 [Verrucomicrobiae bacterium]|nr:hypothetical protein [Verrucomicrobiae bacterium]